jgi:hypothetical protein
MLIIKLTLLGEGFEDDGLAYTGGEGGGGRGVGTNVVGIPAH